MVLAIPPKPRSQGDSTTSSPSIPVAVPLSPMAPTQSIGSISLVPTAGESSPTSVLVDVTASCPNGVSELKRIQGYSDQLLLPEAMVYGNGLIKVWNIEDEQQQTHASNSFDDTTHQTMIRLQEEPTYNKKAFASLNDFPKDRLSANEVPIIFPVEEIDILEEEETEMDMDDLLMALPPTSISLSPRPSLSPLSLPASPLISRDSFNTLPTHSGGSMSTIVLDNLDNNEEVLKPTKPPKGHRRSHRRNKSHYDFQFS